MSESFSSIWTGLEHFGDLFTTLLPSDLGSFLLAFTVLLIGVAIVKIIL